MDGPEDLMDDVPDQKGRQPERRCIASGATRPKAEMLRFVVAPDRQLVPDLKAALPGRGMWLSATRESIKTACKKRLFAKAARAKVEVPDDLAERVEQLLTRRCIDWLSRGRRAGQAVTGFEKVRAELKSGRAGVVLAARDGAEGGRAKVAAVAGTRPVVDILSADEIAEAFGRDHAVHAWIAAGGIADGFRADAARLAGFRKAEPAEEEG